jgi:hypothetical protein
MEDDRVYLPGLQQLHRPAISKCRLKQIVYQGD